MDPAKAPIFVVGTGRSGTTLLRFMLCAHPRIYVSHEASFYVWESLYPRRAPPEGYVDYYLQSPSYDWLRLDSQLVRAKLPPSPTNVDLYTAVMREKAAQYGRVRWGDKTPSHASYLKRIFRDYPEARVIHIVRDPRGVALSLSRMPWAPAGLYANSALIELERRKVAPFRDRMLQIRLEDLLADPRTTMGKVLEYVGEPWDDAVLDHAKNIPDKHDMPPFPWLESAARDRAPAGVPWKSMDPVDVRLVEKHTRKVMKEHGYSPAPLAKEPSRFAVWWRGAREIPSWFHSAGVFLRLSRLSKDPKNFNGPEIKAEWHRLNPGAWKHYPGFELPDPPDWSRRQLAA